MNKYLKITVVILVLVTALFLLFTVFSRHKKLVQPREKAKTKVETKAEAKARIAIVLDDWGNNSSTLELLYEIKHPITIAILPNLRYSRQVAEDAKKNGYQTILHLPLESKSNKGAEKDTLYCSMDENQMREQLKLMLSSVPGISGANNHQGSKGTEDARLMKIVLTELNSENMFFLDSMTTGRSAGSEVAKTVGIRFAKRDVFLDLPPSRMDEGQLQTYIQRQLGKLGTLALKRGYAIGIGHDRKITLGVLKDVIPELEKRGIRFVFLSELVN